MAIIKARLAGAIDGMFFMGKLSAREYKLLHKCRKSNLPACLGNYHHAIADCQKQDLEICKLCKKVELG